MLYSLEEKKVNKKSKMFNPFKRKSRFNDYVVDLGKLKSRGITKQPVDGSVSPSGPSAESGTDMGFLGSMASAASENSGYGSSAANSDEMEKKINSISERLYKILDRMDLVEHKIDRIERKIGLKDEY